MGATYVTAVVRNPAEPERTWEGLFLVDTGATDCLVPKAMPGVRRSANLKGRGRYDTSRRQ